MIEVTVCNMQKSFREGTTILPVLKNITITFEQGKTYAITGVSGTGKSTLLHLLAGLDRPDSGIVYYNGQNIVQFSPQKLDHFHNSHIGLVFQWPYLIRELSVIENIMLPGLIKGLNKTDCADHAHQLLQYVELNHKANEKPMTLSGGQQQRVALARALFNKPPFLLADEPTGNLDKKTGYAIIDLLLSCQKEWNMGLIISSHDEYVANSMQHLYQLKDGYLHRMH